MTASLVAVVTALACAYPWWWLCRRYAAAAVTVLIGFAVFSAHTFALLHRLGLPAEVVRGLIPLKDVLALLLAAVLLPRLFRERLRPLPRRWPALAALGVTAAVTVGAAVSLMGADVEATARAARG
ncbi:MAG: hypothetical protein RLZ55_888, partial [Actinomycetota bacterium]